MSATEKILDASRRMVLWAVAGAAAFAFSAAVAAPLTLTWNGGASGKLSDESWDGGEAGHMSPQNGDTLEFGTGGTFTSDIAGLQVAALKFTSSSAVTISGPEKITVLCGGTVKSTGAGVVTNLAPMQVGESAGESVGFAAVGSGRKLVLIGNISGEAPIGVGSSNGTVEFRGTNTFTGKLSVTNGYFNAVGKDALGLGTEEAYFKTGNGSGAAKVTFTGVIARMPIKNAPGNQSGEITFSRNISLGLDTSKFLGAFTVSGSSQWRIESWVTAVFSNKLSVTGSFQGQADTGGKLELWGAGSYFRDYIFALVGNPSAGGYGTLVVGTPLKLTTWEYYGPTFRKKYGTMKMMAADAFPNNTAAVGWNPLRYLDGDMSGSGDTLGAKGTTFDMNGFDQTFMCIRDEGKQSSNVIKSDSKPCVMRLKQTWSANKGTVLVGDFYGEIRGKVSVSVEGTDPCFFSGPNTSTGSFCLTNGATSGFTSTGVWKGTNYVVSAGSTLVVSNTAALLANSTIALSDAAEQATKSCLLLGDGNFSAKRMTVDGRLLARGTWGSSLSGARFTDDVHFKGPGVLTLATGAPPTGLNVIIR